jgi:hypothetical protein
MILKFIKKLGTSKMSFLASPNPFTSSSPPLSSKPIVESLGEFVVKRTRRFKFFAPS